MTSTESSLLHKSQLKNLCFVCGQHCGSNRRSSVEDFKDELVKVFFLKQNHFNENTPPCFCLNCHAKMGNMKRSCSTAKVTLPDWKPHSLENCFVCNCKPEIKLGRSKKLKTKRGRPSTVSTPCWSRGDIDQILEEVVSTQKLEFSTEFQSELSTRIDNVYLCSACDNVMNIPISNSKCRHSFCHLCIFPKLIGYTYNDASCPICSAVLSPNDVHISKTLLHALKSSKTTCKKCQTSVPLFEIESHERECKDITKISDVFSLTEFPRHVENAALHVIKQKMTNEKTVNFASGGSRVSYYYDLK